MDYFDRDIQRIKQRAQELQLLTDISRGRSLDKLDALAALYRQVIVLHHPHCADAYYVSSRLEKLIGTKPGCSPSDVSDYNKVMHTPDNAGKCIEFVAHFANSTTEHRTTYSFTTSKGDTLWLNTCSCLINPGMGYDCFILTLLQCSDKMQSYAELPAAIMPADDELNEFITKWDKLSNREKETVPLIVQGLKIKEAADKLHISTETFKTHKKKVKSKLGSPYNKDIPRFFFASQLRTTAANA